MALFFYISIGYNASIAIQAYTMLRGANEKPSN